MRWKSQFTNKHVLECKILNNLPPMKFRSSLSTTRTTQKNVGNSNVWIHGLLPSYTHLQVNHEKTLITFHLYWLVNRDPYNGLLQSPYSWVLQSSLYPNQPRVFPLLTWKIIPSVSQEIGPTNGPTKNRRRKFTRGSIIAQVKLRRAFGIILASYSQDAPVLAGF